MQTVHATHSQRPLPGVHFHVIAVDRRERLELVETFTKVLLPSSHGCPPQQKLLWAINVKAAAIDAEDVCKSA
jgi:hypothetical protein